MKSMEQVYFGGMPARIARVSHTNFRTLVRWQTRTLERWPEGHERTYWELVGCLPWTLQTEADAIREEVVTESWFRLRNYMTAAALAMHMLECQSVEGRWPL